MPKKATPAKKIKAKTPAIPEISVRSREIEAVYAVIFPAAMKSPYFWTILRKIST
ncbi:hypothetical protein LMZ02_25055 [Paenibacillus macerans]|uniref:hypothetical protein n=1 Tax=Paenibacillus macerans TaxID=44252 RepID=UPI001D130D35|nr:hypothetical protein [Paenibacillus macerans]MBS5909532.1 hypothetical protein [Paenibacillus macerans]UMV46709.1 hypothetical protein LMZ02_25055 [Paenibacillus macerans]